MKDGAAAVASTPPDKCCSISSRNMAGKSSGQKHYKQQCGGGFLATTPNRGRKEEKVPDKSQKNGDSDVQIGVLVKKGGQKGGNVEPVDGNRGLLKKSREDGCFDVKDGTSVKKRGLKRWENQKMVISLERNEEVPGYKNREEKAVKNLDLSTEKLRE